MIHPHISFGNEMEGKSCATLEQGTSGRCYQEVWKGSACHIWFQEWIHQVSSKRCGLGCWNYMITKKESNGHGDPCWQDNPSVNFSGPLTKSNPADRSKPGAKRHVFNGLRGYPLSVSILSTSTLMWKQYRCCCWYGYRETCFLS